MLLHDIYLARQLSAAVHIAEAKRIAPDEAVRSHQAFSSFWLHETYKLEDMRRQQGCMPNVFVTIAPAEWDFVMHEGMLGAAKADGVLSDHQAVLTLHIYNAFAAILERLFSDARRLAEFGIRSVREWSMRFDFQSRGRA